MHRYLDGFVFVNSFHGAAPKEPVVEPDLMPIETELPYESSLFALLEVKEDGMKLL